MCSNLVSRVLILAWLSAMTTAQTVASQNNYKDALSKCLLFFEGQRSGKLPPSQRLTWRKDSALKDGSDIGRDLVGGYYDAGDNVKFNFPMAFTTTMLSWSVLEFGNSMGADHEHALEAIRWGTDYFLKATSVPDSVVGAVGDPNGDHTCWQRPEDMDTPRTSYVVTKEKPGSEVSAEIAAALAASSMVFKDSDKDYSALLLKRSIEVFEFADKYRGSYGDSIGSGVCPFYCDFSGYMDELVWGATWLYKATNTPDYWNYVRNNIVGDITEFGWDSKHAGINVLVSQVKFDANNSSPFILKADQLVCSILPESPAQKSVTYSPGGLLFKPGGSNLQHTTSLSFLLSVYAGYMKANNKVVDCGNNVVVTPAKLVDFTKGQVDYILGKNPLGMSYMVGFGQKFPQKIHHRGSVIPSIDQHPQHIECHGGDEYFKSNSPNPNLLTGAIVGGPAENDTFEDSRSNVAQSEPTTYINAAFVGVLAHYAASYCLD
ncbi:endoglucanase 4-like [Pyrus x bretschneideri]|uniref:endoglucanase 4-like n=1 Tax=Pyrus x bretschneideri TaxID=225117 RepID=UPI0020300F25|nr:endoglucanase 4-like [Pyrus x bretschneideri]